MKSSTDVLLPPAESTSDDGISKANYIYGANTPKGKSNRRLIVIAVSALIATSSIGIIIASGKPNTKPQLATQSAKKPVLTVTVKRPVLKQMQSRLSVHGSVAAWDPVSVGATASGLEVKSIRVEEGAFVKKGDVLAVLDSAQLQAQLDSETARLHSSVANVSKSIQPNRPEDINALAAAVAQAEANVQDAEAALIQAQENLSNASINVKRYRALRVDGAVSEQESENRVTTEHIDEANVRSAKERVKAAVFSLKQYQERLTMARQGGRKEDIDIARASVAEISGNIRKLKTEIEQTIIKAPVKGQITRRDTHLGDISAAGKPMFLMARDNRLELKAQVPEADLKAVKPGQAVTIDSALTGKGQIVGRVREISPLVDSENRLATVRIDVPSDCGLKSGMYAEGHIDLGKDMALTVPSQAINSRDEKNTVFVVHGDTIESRQVVLGNRDSNIVQIVSGLKESESIVIDGGGFLKDGDCVAVASSSEVK